MKMLVEKSHAELESSSPTTPTGLRRTVVGRHRQGFVAEDYEDDSPNYFARASLDVKNLSTLEDFPETLITPPSYEESETSAGIDEIATPHHITINSLSVSEPLPIPKHPHVWQIKRTTITLSALEATVLVKSGILAYKDLRLFVFPPLSLDSLF
jgi:hypothetical protein